MAPTNTSLAQYVDYLCDAGTDLRLAWTDGPITVDLGGLSGQSEMRASALLALDAWTATTGLVFETAASGADISFTAAGRGNAYTSTEFFLDGRLISAEVVISADWMNGFPADERWGVGDYGMQTFIHEIGHALGLNHGGPYDGDADWERDAIFTRDTNQYSVMSYFEQSENGSVADDLNLATPMLADVAAIRELYGVRATNAGNTIYGRDGLYDFGAFDEAAFTIADTSGAKDLIDLRETTAGARLSMAAGAFSDVNGFDRNLCVAAGTTIENAYGTTRNDVISGNAADNLIRAFGGADRIVAGAGDDVLDGGGGRDVLSGGAGADQFRYLALAEIAGDLILDFRSGVDKISLRALDADATLAGNQAFTFIGHAAYGREPGELRYGFRDGDTLLTGDLDGDARNEFSLRFEGVLSFEKSDFLL